MPTLTYAAAAAARDLGTLTDALVALIRAMLTGTDPGPAADAAHRLETLAHILDTCLCDLEHPIDTTALAAALPAVLPAELLAKATATTDTTPEATR
jgi:hypothetical protein